MLRSLFSGISGLRSHQTMLDVTGNNIANVNTTGYKSSQVQFQDTLSQLVSGGGSPQAGTGGVNPSQVGLGVKVAGITTSFTQGASQLTGRSTDMMIQGDGFFVVSKGGQTYYTRAGGFDFDPTGQLVLPGEGAKVQGWLAVNGVIDPDAPVTDLRVPAATLMPASATTRVTLTGNLASDAADGTTLVRDVTARDSLGAARTVTLTFTRTAGSWSVGATDGTATLTPSTLAFDTDSGALASAGTLDLGGVTVDLAGVTGYAGVDSVAGAADGRSAGELVSFALAADGTITGAFSNGSKQVIGRIAMAAFTNPAGLVKAGGSLFSTSVNAGDPQVGTPGSGGRGTLAGGALEMSNVDLSSEFTSLIIAQRGFQANSRVITTSDEILQELVNLKR